MVVIDTWTHEKARSALEQIFRAAIASADPTKVISRHLPPLPKGRCVVVGAGKASAAMAAGLEAAWPNVRLSGVVATRYGYTVPTDRIEVLEAGHPIPDKNSEIAATRMLEAVRSLTEGDLVIALISGGGSALLTSPAGRMTLADKQIVNRTLLESGASITEMNVVRKHLSGIKGGRLARAARPARVVTLVISDIPGDNLAAIASGPTLPDLSSKADALGIVRRYGLVLPSSAMEVLGADEAPLTTDELTTDVRLIGTPAQALQAAASTARQQGLTPLILGDAIEGEAREVSTVMAGIARSVASHGCPIAPPAILLSGGETTVSIGTGRRGRGGRNMEFLLGLAVALDGNRNVWALAGDSDGIDGTEDAAGAFVTPDILSRARSAGFDPLSMLASHDSYTLFQSTGDLVWTGPTLTNVNDIRAVLVTPAS